MRNKNRPRTILPGRELRGKRVIVAMSGGVDSSVAAALLKRAGFDVIGVFMKFWKPRSGATRINPKGVRLGGPYGAGTDGKTDLPGYENRCCSTESEKRARAVADKLGIPFYVFNFEKEFKKKVVDYFLREQKAGLTPNPCIVCNKEIKFKLLWKKVMALDADYIATGHYARLRREFPISNSQFPKYRLLRAKDKEKDQSYFLWQLNQKMLKKILFPVGQYTKTEIRKLAKKFKLPVLDIPESQEICFIQTTTADFLKKHLKSKPGKIIDSRGKVIGEHQGLWFYTIGQRRGIELPGGPFYVLDKDLKRNTLIVTQNEKDLYKKELFAKNVSWVEGKPPKLPLKIKAKIRYRHKPASSVISKQKNAKIKVVFVRPQRAITPGQSVVFYKGQELLGGGTIDKFVDIC